MIQAAARYDLIEKAGPFPMPTTFDELIKVCEATHGQGGCGSFHRRQACITGTGFPT